MTINLLGTRVVRGQDWEWGNQDGGEGFVGTVVQVGRDKKSPATEQLVYVQWDCGGKHNYRAGIEKKHDLRIFSFTNGDAKHLFRSCDGCKEDPIIGLRWHCLDCPNYDLCSKCYMNDFHDVNHRFERFHKSRAKGTCVGKREGATKLEARGMFKGAKVTRGPDWEWKEQDNQPLMEGEVTEVTSWSDETNNDAVRVNWNKGPKEDIYRLGTNGKVDLKCTSPAVGGYYYRDHLPPITMQIRKSKSGFTTGDKVYLQKLAVVKLQELSAGHGGWNAGMERYIGKIGVVQDFTTDGDVVVEYRDRSWRYNPAALTKIQKFKQGDEVVVKSDENLVKELQKEHGGWNESMISILGRTGKVLEVDSDGDVLVSVEGTRWMLSPASVTSVTDPDPQQLTEAGDMGSEDPLGLFSLFRDFLRQAREREEPGLVNAAGSNNLLRLKEILDANPEQIDELAGGHTALHVACHQGHCDIIRELLERGANIDILDNQGYTAMHHSTYQDESGEALKLLLERGFDPNVQHRSNKSTPLHLAVKRKNETAVQILTQCPECDINQQDEAGDTPLHDAIDAEHHNMVDMLLDCPRTCYTLCNRKGFNYLQHAVLRGNKRAVERIFAKTGNSLNVVKDDGFTTLHIAAINDHREIAKILLTKPGCEVDAPTAKNHSALHLAAIQGYSVMVEMLLDHGANVNAVDYYGNTALHITLMKEHEQQRNLLGLDLLLGVRKKSASFVAVTRSLLSYGAEVLKANDSGETPLDKCRGSEVEQLIREIAACGGTTHNKKIPSFESLSWSQEMESEDIKADIDLVNAARSNNLSRLTEILDVNPERIDDLVGGHTALHVACRQGHCDIIRELLERGANMDIVDNQGYTAMHLSTYQDESGEALKLLLEKGFDPNVQQRSNKSTPLHLAVERRNETAVRILTQCPECDVNLQDEAGDTPLHCAIFLQRHSMMDILLDCSRISVTLCNGKGFNYLQLAVLKGNKRAVERIFATTGNSLNVINNDGFTTLHIAAINNHLEIAKILLRKPGCEVDSPTAENESALHLAADKGYSLMVGMLLDHGADVNAVDNDGDTALHITLMKEGVPQGIMGLMPGLELLFGARKSNASFVAVSRCLLSYGADVLKANDSGQTPLDKCRGSEVEQLIRKIAACGGTTHNKKVPSFGSSCESQTELELGDASSSASATTLTDGTEKDNENQIDSSNSADEAEDTFLRDVISDLCSGDQQESVSEMSDETESEDVQEGETAESVLQETALENVVLEVTNNVEVETSASDISNNSVVQPAEMAENNTDTDMDDSEGPQSQTQSANDDVNMDQGTENEEKNPSTSDDQKVLCYICEETEAVVAFKPCGHTVVCTECAARLKKCLECKTPITGRGTRDGTPIIGINNKSLVSRYQQVEAKLRKLEESVVCCICVERKKDIIFRCGHGTCQFCAKQLSICHICQKHIEMKIQIF
ncbi:E3 ubiquitin-protein ligase MIB2-like isoform X3 [Pocillopora verrucosa]|uniref:E3 ubiquitin-protein ligase MIB2-like isoform X3 n=1 Tax=Pocillopora verrucosa TaxID=203993 RepID=UPI00333F5166